MHGAPPEQIGAIYCTPAERSGEEEMVCVPPIAVNPQASPISRMAHRTIRFALFCIIALLPYVEGRLFADCAALIEDRTLLPSLACKGRANGGYHHMTLLQLAAIVTQGNTLLSPITQPALAGRSSCVA